MTTVNERSFNPAEPVMLAACSDYNCDAIYDILTRAETGINIGDLSGKRVVIKPNLVMKKHPDSAATVHPDVTGAVIRLLRDHGADNIIIAESPGGVYNAQRLRGVYNATQTADAAEKYGAELNFDDSFEEVYYPEGKICRLFDVIKPILEADVIVDICKLKNHTLTGMSAAVKNLFGVIPGVVKFEMHSRYPEYNDFSEMLTDLSSLIISRCDFICVTDAIVGMEGNGPTSGTPRKIGALLMSRNPYASDVVSSALIGCEGHVQMHDCAESRGYAPKKAADCNIISIDGATTDGLRVDNFVPTDTIEHNIFEILRKFGGGKIYGLFRPYPKIDYSSCLGCGECAASCPKHTIVMRDKSEIKSSGADKSKAHKLPVIIRDDCIRCFCCQELCPHGVVKIKKNPIMRWLS